VLDVGHRLGTAGDDDAGRSGRDLSGGVQRTNVAAEFPTEILTVKDVADAPAACRRR
jgi:hypothetical protein